MTPSLSRLRRNADAHSVVEYAVCLGLIAIGILGIGIAIAGPMQRAFSLSDAVAGSNGDRRSNAAAAERGTADASARSSKQEADDPRTAAIDARILWPAFALAAATPFAAWWFVRRRLRQAAVDDEPVVAIQPKLRAKFVEKRQAILSVLSSEIKHLSQGQVPVAAIYSTKIFTLPPETPVEELRQAMKDRWIRHVLVCSKSGSLLGVVSDRDLLSRRGDQAQDIMTRNPITVTRESPVSTVITIMLAQQISCIPVVEDDRLLGIVTTSDVLMSLQCLLRLMDQIAAPAEAPSAGSLISQQVEHDLLVCTD